MRRVENTLLAIVLVIVVFMSFCLPEEPKFIPKIKKLPVKEEILDIPCEEEVYYGKASYYGEYWNGRNTANMEIYDCEKLTCASPSLPFNTILKVTNLSNNKSIIIRVNDRGPFKMDENGKVLRPLEPHPKRILDLSKASFEAIGNLDKGVINIKYEIVG